MGSDIFGCQALPLRFVLGFIGLRPASKVLVSGILCSCFASHTGFPVSKVLWAWVAIS